MVKLPEGGVRPIEPSRTTVPLPAPSVAPPLAPEASIAAGLALTKEAARGSATQIAARRDDPSFEKFHRGKEPVDAAAFMAITGIAVSSADAARLDAQVQATAAKMGLDHPCGFSSEVKFAGRYYPYAFLGMFETHSPEKKIHVGLGMLAKEPADIELLFKLHGSIDPRLRPMLEDFIAMSPEQKVQAVLVHESLELDAVRGGARNPHRSAVEDAPRTELRIDPRVRRHLELYARLDRQLFGPVP